MATMGLFQRTRGTASRNSIATPTVGTTPVVAPIMMPLMMIGEAIESAATKPPCLALCAPTSKLPSDARTTDPSSDVFVCCQSALEPESLEPEIASIAPAAPLALIAPAIPTAAAAPAPTAAAAGGVTLFVYGWHNVQPGPLWWVFPSLRAALDAVRAMRNAVKWCVVAGEEFIGLEAARAKGAVLVEQFG